MEIKLKSSQACVQDTASKNGSSILCSNIAIVVFHVVIDLALVGVVVVVINVFLIVAADHIIFSCPQ